METIILAGRGWALNLTYDPEEFPGLRNCSVRDRAERILTEAILNGMKEVLHQVAVTMRECDD